MDENDPMKPLDPAYVKVMRLGAALFCSFLLIGALVLEIGPLAVPGAFLIPVAFFSAWWVLVVPSRRYRRWRYALGDDRLRVERGYFFYTDTVVPLGRIQHIDVEQGPIMRRYGLATLTVHTAGHHGASVSLPGLRHEVAVAMRESIRENIKASQQ